MTEEKRSRVLGMILASVSRGVFPQREPIGYLYGHVAKEGETPTHNVGGVDYVGVVAPGLPECGFPYATVEYETIMGFAYLCFSSVPLEMAHKENGNIRVEPTAECEYVEYWFAPDIGISGWDFDKSGVANADFPLLNTDVTWASYNVYNDNDGSLYIASSDPIPIYE